MKCKAITCKGKQCNNNAEPGSTYCHTHIKQKTFVFDQMANKGERDELKAYIKRESQWKGEHTGKFFPESLPERCYTMFCGARTRKGTQCMRMDIYPNGRCRLHGGLSTGPQSKEGLAKVAQNLPWAKNQTK